MSLDLKVWSEHPFELPRGLPCVGAPEWEEYNGEWTYDGGTWQVIVMPCPPGELPGATEAVRAKRPSARYLAFVTLEPVGAGRPGYHLTEKIIRSLAREYDGVWGDDQQRMYDFDEGEF